MCSISKRIRLLVFIAILVVAYFGSAIAFRSYKANPESDYYAANVPENTTQTFDTEDEAIEFLLSPFEEREPTFLDRVYAPAEAIFRSVGF